MSKSDPMVYAFVGEGGQWRHIGNTEMIKDNLNPKFAKCFVVKYHFEKTTTLLFRVYDIDDEKDLREEKQEFLGEVIIDLGSLVSNQTTPFQQYLSMKKNRKASLSIRTAKAANISDDVKRAGHVEVRVDGHSYRAERSELE
mmetsp:Transcript_29104/g.74761  ORF Transcript_29104/g.74761 Transcript_29104/m.74761 type:complete len:142 (-) Transcript_29104:1856-2281(-)